MTRKTALAFGIGASFLLAAGVANADCASEVNALQQQLGQAETSNTTIGPSDPGVQQPSPSASVDTSTMPAPDSDQIASEAHGGANTTIGPTDPGPQQPQNEDLDVTAESSDTTEPSTMSPTIAETSRVGEMDTAAGGRVAAITSLKKAQLHADAGEEDACMSELGMAKQHLGVE